MVQETVSSTVDACLLCQVKDTSLVLSFVVSEDEIRWVAARILFL